MAADHIPHGLCAKSVPSNRNVAVLQPTDGGRGNANLYDYSAPWLFRLGRLVSGILVNGGYDGSVVIGASRDFLVCSAYRSASSGVGKELR
jgi:hypothetical protein